MLTSSLTASGASTAIATHAQQRMYVLCDSPFALLFPDHHHFFLSISLLLSYFLFCLFLFLLSACRYFDHVHKLALYERSPYVIPFPSYVFPRCSNLPAFSLALHALCLRHPGFRTPFFLNSEGILQQEVLPSPSGDSSSPLVHCLSMPDASSFSLLYHSLPKGLAAGMQEGDVESMKLAEYVYDSLAPLISPDSGAIIRVGVLPVPEGACKSYPASHFIVILHPSSYRL